MRISKYLHIYCEDNDIKFEETDIPEWIPRTEALPPNKTYVFVTISIPGRSSHIRSSWYEDGLFINDNGDVWKSTDREVTAWMFQPKPYGVED